MTKTILAEAVTRGSAIQKMTVALDDRVEPVANVRSKMLPGGCNGAPHRRVGFDEQIFGADEQVPGRGRRD
jgi:hypothetical protein